MRLWKKLLFRILINSWSFGFEKENKKKKIEKKRVPFDYRGSAFKGVATLVWRKGKKKKNNTTRWWRWGTIQRISRLMKDDEAQKNRWLCRRRKGHFEDIISFQSLLEGDRPLIHFFSLISKTIFGLIMDNITYIYMNGYRLCVSSRT